MSKDREETEMEKVFKSRLDLLRDETLRDTAVEMLEDWVEEAIECCEMIDQITEQNAEDAEDSDAYLTQVKHERKVLNASFQNVLDGVDVGIEETSDPLCREMMRRVGFILNKTILTLQIGRQQELLQVKDSAEDTEMIEDEAL